MSSEDAGAHRTFRPGTVDEQKLLRLIFENLPEVAIIAMDLDGRITSWNPGAERLLGHSASEVLGQHARIIFTPEDREQGEAERELRLARQHGRAEDERWHLRRDGTRFWGSGVVMLVRGDGKPVGLVKIMRDMTAQHQLQEQRKAHARELERRVAEATAALQRRARQLEVLGRHLQEAERRERRRLAKVLHDELQQLLAAVSMRVQFVQNESAPPGALGEAQRILEQAIDTARTLSHELSPAVLSNEGFVPALHWLAQTMQQRHQIPVEVEADDQLTAMICPTVGDTLLQMARELLFNVIKHADASRAWIVATRTESGGARLTVADDGVGFDEAVIAGEKPESTHGLHDIREKLTLWSGEMRIEPREGGGSRVVLEIAQLPESNAA